MRASLLSPRRNFAAHSAQKLSRFRERFPNLARVCSAALRTFRSASAFPLTDGRDFLNDPIRLKLRCRFFWDGCDECDRSVRYAHQENGTVRLWLERVHDC